MNPGAKFSAWTTLLHCVSIVFGMRQVFRKQPVNSSSVEGLWVLMECEVEGVTGPVQWVRDGLLLGPGTNLPGFPRYTVTGNSAAGVFNLQIENVQLEDDTSYQCQVGQSEESMGIISHTAWLDILIPPQIPVIDELSTQSTLTWVSGKEYLLTCHAKDSKPASSIIFMKNGVELIGSESKVNPGSKAKLFTTVSIIRVTPEDSDNGNELVCGAVNSALSQPRTLSFRMNILFPPEIPTIDGYSRGQVNAGETLSLVCTSIGGNPLAALQWLKNDEVLSQEWETDVSTRTSRSSLSYPVRPEDDGIQLTCQAINQVTANPLRRVIILHVIFAPKRVMILGLARVVEGEQIFLSCITSGSNPPARIRWWAAGKELNVTDVTYRTAALGGVSTVSNVSMLTSRQDNGMSVTCDAVNEAVFLSRSASIIVQVHYPPERIWIQGPPETTPFPAGSQVTLSCWVSGGNPPARLTWKKGLKTVLGAMYKSTGTLASSEITINTEPSDNLAKYTCSTSSDGKLNPLTAVTQISVQFAPISMRISASAQTVHQGDLLTLTCHIGSSNPIPEISWIKDGIRFPAAQLDIRTVEFGGQALEVDLSLVIGAWDDGRRVVCEAYSPALREARNTFHQLNVLYPPQFLPSQVGIVSAEERGAVIFPVRISANPPEVTYSWSRNGQLLVKDGPTRHHLRSDGSLEIWNLSRHDAGLYSLHVGNQEGETQRDLKLDVKYSPRISRLTDPAEVDLGESVELICTADANPVISNMVKWAWTGEGRRVTLDDQVFLNETTKLLIGGATRGDAGYYECSADNGIPPAAMARAELIVRFKPVLRKGVDLSKVAVIGDGSSAVTLTCKAEGIPDVQFHWAKNGVSLDPNIPRYSQTVRHEGALHTAQLVIRNVSSALDFGTFTCTAQNPLGLDTFDTQLGKINRPDSPTALTLLSRTHNSVTLSWEPGFNGGLEQTFQIRYTSADSGGDLYTDVYPAQARSFTITGLRFHTVYNFSVSARNALGTSGYTDMGNLLNVSTSDSGGHYPVEGPYTPALRTGGIVFSLPVLLPILSLCLLLILLNVGIILALRLRGTGGETNKSTSPCVTQLELNDYSDDLVNAMTKRTLLMDTGSEMCSTGFEHYDDVDSVCQEEALVWGHGLPHTPRSIPRVNPLRDGDQRIQQHITTGCAVPGPGLRVRDPHREAAGGEEGLYEDVSEETEPGIGQSKYCLNPNQHSLRSHPAVLLTGGFPAGALAALSQSDHRFGMLGELV